MRIAMIGAGYVGLVSGACFSEFGVETTCVDRNAERIAGLQRSEMPIYEPGLEDLVRKNVAAGRLFFTDKLAEAVRVRRTRSSSRLARRAVGATVMPICPTSLPPRGKSRSICTATRSW